MRRTVFAVASLVLALGAALAPAGAASAGEATANACQTTDSGTVSGGYEVTLWCPFEGGYFQGYGSTLTAANQEAILLHRLYLTYGVDCSGTDIDGVTGGYEVTLWCPFNGGYVAGYGSNLTGAAVNARKLAELYAITGVGCSGTDVDTATGGYEAAVACGAANSIGSYGTTLTDAGTEALLLAQLFATSGVRCSGTDVARISGGYEVTLWCPFNGGYVEGVGSTLTGAAQNARLAAGG